VKWQSSDEDAATWERPERLHSTYGGVFTAANAHEVPQLIDQYLLRERGPPPSRLRLLTFEQQLIVDRLRDALRLAEPVALVGRAGCGRVFAVRGFRGGCRRLSS
jgi:hypothetical protein